MFYSKGFVRHNLSKYSQLKPIKQSHRGNRRPHTWFHSADLRHPLRKKVIIWRALVIFVKVDIRKFLLVSLVHKRNDVPVLINKLDEPNDRYWVYFPTFVEFPTIRDQT